jgi:hypothetical protein
MDTALRYGHYYAQSPAALGDSFTQSCFLRAGVYIFLALNIRNTDAPIIDWYLDGVKIGGGDWYGTAPVQFSAGFGNIVVSYDGYHVLKGVVAGKNASSSGYKMALTKYWFRMLSD